MVRVLVAFLIEVGKGRHEVSDVPKLLESKNRKNVPFTAPAEGLYLEKYLDENELLKTLVTISKYIVKNHYKMTDCH